MSKGGISNKGNATPTECLMEVSPHVQHLIALPQRTIDYPTTVRTAVEWRNLFSLPAEAAPLGTKEKGPEQV